MKAKRMASTVGISLLFACMLASQVPSAEPIGSSFTYQGRLDDGGSPANGLYDFKFVLYDAPTGGAKIAETELGDVAVSEGLFAVELDFGASAFNGEM